jgi:hypothetical protein
VNTVSSSAKLRKTGALLLAGFSIVCSAPANACSLAAGYKEPTNYELVKKADIVLVGKVVKYAEKEEIGPHKIFITPTLRLKGVELPKAVYIHGMLDGDIVTDGPKKWKIQSKDSQPLDIWRSHPEGSMGGCSRSTFKKGNQLLLFFSKKGDKLEWIDPPFGRGAEDVSGPDALWVRAVKIYAKASLLPEKQQRAELSRQMAIYREGKVTGRSHENELLADDIERQLDGVTGGVFLLEDPKADKWTRWQNNITNSIYNAMFEPIEVKDKPAELKPDWKLVSLLLGLLNFIFAIAIVALLKKRKTTA